MANDPHPPIAPSSTCLVTGAAGFVGAELARTLLRTGVTPDRLRCLVRSRESARAQGIPDECMVLGDLRDRAVVESAVDGCGLLFHLAGTIKGSRPADFLPVNRDATGLLADAVARRAPEAFVVHVSSLAAAGPSVDGVGTDRGAEQCRTVSAYGESKRLGELEMTGRVRRCAVVRPPVVYGPGDSATRLLFRSANGPLCFVPRRSVPLSVVHVRDVVDSLLAVAHSQPAGTTLTLDGPDRTDTHALLASIAASCSRRARFVPLPLSVAAVAAFCCDVYSRASGRMLHFNRDKVRELRAAGWVGDAGRLAALTGFRARVRLQDGLLEVARAEGLAR